jgi:class 3 adenylate cyclase
MRVHRTFAFVDVSGFTALTELEGDERAVDVLTAFRALLRDICSRRGVRIAKWLGDGVMLVCVETRPLLESILELHFVVGEVSGPVSTVSIRSGITSGHVLLMEGDDYVGHCVNVAARLCDLAPVGEALADPSVMGHLPSWGTVVHETPVALRGVEKPVPASSIRLATAGVDGARDPICGLPLSHDTAEEIAHDVRGSVVLFCSEGCVDTWRRRPSRSGVA